MRWGERLEFTAEADPGDFVFVPPYVPHQEINALAGEPLQCVVVRSDQEAVVVNLDIAPAEEVEEVRWVDPNHPESSGDEHVTRLEVVSDPVCPGATSAPNLMRAVARTAGASLRDRLAAFQLDPDPAAGGHGPRRLPRGEVRRRGAVGTCTPASSDGRPRPASASTSHPPRAEHARRAPADPLAEAEGLQTRGRSRCSALLRRGEDMSDRGAARRRRGGGLDGAVSRRCSRRRRPRRGRAQAEAAQEMGVTGVPTFLVGGRYVVTGAQPPELWTA